MISLKVMNLDGRKIVSKSYIIYGKQDCPNCKTAKQMLDHKGINYKYKSVPEDLSREELFLVMESFEVVPRSFPQVVMIDDEKLAHYVGGVPELLKSFKENNL